MASIARAELLSASEKDVDQLSLVANRVRYRVSLYKYISFAYKHVLSMYIFYSISMNLVCVC